MVPTDNHIFHVLIWSKNVKTDHFSIFYVFSIYKVHFCVMRPCGLEDGYQCCEGTCCIFLCDCFCTAHIPRCLTSLLPCRLRQQFPWKHSQAYIRFLRVQSRKIKCHLHLLLCLSMPWMYKNCHLLRPSKFSSCTPVPLSITSTSSLPYSLRRTSITLAPASKLFSTSSFTAVAKVRTTWAEDYYTVNTFYLSYHKFQCIRWPVISYG